MGRPLVIGLAVAALAAGGSAVAVAASDELFAGPKEREAQFARELSSHLNGVTPAEMQGALEKVREQHMAQRRAELAKDLASRLDVSVDAVEKALDKAHAQMEQAFESGRRPEPGAFVKTLADELGKSETQVRQALGAARRERLKERLDAAVKAGRLTRARARANAILEHADDRPFGHGPGGPGGPMGGPPPPE